MHKIITLILLMFSLISLCSCDSVDSSATSHLSYDFINQYLMFHHVVYDGVDYYMLDSEHDVPDEFIPFAEEKIYVTLVDEEGKAYESGRLEEARLYQNDEDKMYIYYQSAPYTRDKSLALKGLDLE